MSGDSPDSFNNPYGQPPQQPPPNAFQVGGPPPPRKNSSGKVVAILLAVFGTAGICLLSTVGLFAYSMVKYNAAKARQREQMQRVFDDLRQYEEREDPLERIQQDRDRMQEDLDRVDAPPRGPGS